MITYTSFQLLDRHNVCATASHPCFSLIRGLINNDYPSSHLEYILSGAAAKYTSTRTLAKFRFEHVVGLAEFNLIIKKDAERD